MSTLWGILLNTKAQRRRLPTGFFLAAGPIAVKVRPTLVDQMLFGRGGLVVDADWNNHEFVFPGVRVIRYVFIELFQAPADKDHTKWPKSRATPVCHENR